MLIIAAEFGMADTVMTPCDGYGVFCCGQDNAARECCNSLNKTGQVRPGTGEIIAINSTTVQTTTITAVMTVTGSSSSAQFTQQDLIRVSVPLGVVLGCAIIALAVLGTSWWHKRKLLSRPGRGDILLEQSQR
jgi:hypothetical protein